MNENESAEGGMRRDNVYDTKRIDEKGMTGVRANELVMRKWMERQDWLEKESVRANV